MKTNVRYLFMGHSHVLNLNGRYPLPSRLDHILDSVRDAHEAQGVNASHISSAEPAILIHCFLWSLRKRPASQDKVTSSNADTSMANVLRNPLKNCCSDPAASGGTAEAAHSTLQTDACFSGLAYSG